MKKNLIKILTLVVLLTTILPAFTFADEDVFTDTWSSYAKDEIEYLFKEGILTGVGEGKFNPKGKMDRAQLSTVLVRVLKLQGNKENAKKFTDVAQDAWYTPYIGAIAETGITVGTSQTTFSPERNITKQELIVFYIRGLGLEEKAKEMNIKSEFTDEDEIGDWAKDSVGLATYLGLVHPISNNNGTFRFEPKAEVDRELLADITYRLYNNRTMYYNILGMDDQIYLPVEPIETPRPIDPVKPVEPIEPIEPIEPTEPTEPGKPIIPIDPIKPTPVEPSNPVNPNIPDIEDDKLEITNAVGKQVGFMGAYLVSIEFDIKGNLGRRDVKLIINDGLSNEMQIKQGDPKNFDFYFDGMVIDVENVTLYIGNEKFDLSNIINWQ